MKIKTFVQEYCSGPDLVRRVVVPGLILLLLAIGVASYFDIQLFKPSRHARSIELYRLAEAAGEGFEFVGTDLQILSSGDLFIRQTFRAVSNGKYYFKGLAPGISRAHVGPENNLRVHKFEILRVMKDGRNEHYEVRRLNDLTERVYMYDPGRNVTVGPHTYELVYKVSGAVDRLGNKHRLHWTVFHDFWALPVKTAHVTVRLPGSVQITQLRSRAYTAAEGNEKSRARVVMGADGASVKHWLSDPIEPLNGFYLEAEWPAIAAVHEG